jgi:hypothetical protein
VAVLRETELPALVVLPQTDAFLTSAGLEQIAATCRLAGHQLQRFDGDHHELVARSLGREQKEYSSRVASELFAPEREFLGRVLARGAD